MIVGLEEDHDPIDGPRLKTTFEVILFFEVIYNLAGVII